MKKRFFSLQQIERDLGLNVPYVRGNDVPVRKCWHFMTDGKAVDVMFYDDTDFVDGINRIYVVAAAYDVIILAFVLMDTHVHFILYGDFDQCNRFLHEYIRRTSMAISFRHGDRKKLASVRVSSQMIDTQDYLKTAICYVVKNPTNAGMDYLPMDYPWSSGSLYFRMHTGWTSPKWAGTMVFSDHLADMTDLYRKTFLKTNDKQAEDAEVSRDMVFPGTFVNYSLVERIFRTHRGYLFHLGRTKDEDVELRGNSESGLSVSIQELRQIKTELCKELFGENSSRKLAVTQRIKLAKTMKRQVGCSGKLIARVCGLSYDEVAAYLK